MVVSSSGTDAPGEGDAERAILIGIVKYSGALVGCYMDAQRHVYFDRYCILKCYCGSRGRYCQMPVRDTLAIRDAPLIGISVSGHVP